MDGGVTMKNISKGKLIALLVGLYVLSPLDLLPGSVDDLVVVILSVMKALENNRVRKFLED